MSWQQIYPEGSTVFIGRDAYTVRHNSHFSAFDLFQRGELMLTVNAKILPTIADAVRFP
ncbi:hypothetical protein [Rhizobium nepotum]|uniref:hypothetical protein n=1 Tax=Rhizobium nepotum TaxID=1035271 RepID=UPI003CEB77A1